MIPISVERAKELARAAVSEVVPVPANSSVVVERATEHPWGAYRLRIEMHEPEGYFTHDGAIRVTVHATTGKAQTGIWRLDAAGADLPNPQAIANRFMFKRKHHEKDPELAIKLMHRWFDAHRASDAYGMSHNFAYDRLTWAYRESKDPSRLPGMLRAELKKNPGLWATFEIDAQLAKWHEGRKEWKEAMAF
jgi:hypothetical protein